MFNIFTKEKKTKTLSDGLKKTRQGFGERLKNLFLGKSVVDDSLIEDVEMMLLSADVGVKTTERLIGVIKENVKKNRVSQDEIVDSIKSTLSKLLLSPPKSKKDGNPKVILVVGVNGVGKTTTVAKIATHCLEQGQTVMVAAGDTYRAAAIQQLQTWCDRLSIPLVAQQYGADPAAVVYDAVSSAKAKKLDVMIADTAGRLHTQGNLMNELEKVKRVLKKLDPSAPHETLMVIDATTGQTALNQVKVFADVLGLDGLILTKLDGTAKGGVVFSIQEQFKLPIYYIGVGEGAEDLVEFDPNHFVEALFE